MSFENPSALKETPKAPETEIHSIKKSVEDVIQEFEKDEGKVFESPEVKQAEERDSRVKRLKKAFAGITAGIMMLCATPAFAEKTTGEQSKDNKKIEQIMEKQDQMAMDFLKNLVEKMPQGKTAQERIMRKQAMLNMLREFALRLSQGVYDKEYSLSGNVGREQLKDAVGVLDRNMADFADREFGNKDGKVGPEEFEKIRQNPNMKELQIIIMQYAR